MALMDMQIEELEALLKERGQPAFRARQLFNWLSKGTPLEQMSNLPLELREKLKEYPLGGAGIYSRLVSRLDGTRKYLFSLMDGNIIEGVL